MLRNLDKLKVLGKKEQILSVKINPSFTTKSNTQNFSYYYDMYMYLSFVDYSRKYPLPDKSYRCPVHTTDKKPQGGGEENSLIMVVYEKKI